MKGKSKYQETKDCMYWGYQKQGSACLSSHVQVRDFVFLFLFWKETMFAYSINGFVLSAFFACELCVILCAIANQI
jgi:hypothetical protein